MNCLQSLVLFIATIGSSSDLIYYLVLLLLLLLSGDVELNPGPITGKHTLNTTLINWYTTAGNPKDILRTHSVKLTDGISNHLYKITTELHAKGLIPQQAVDDVLVMGVMTDYTKAMKLMSVLHKQLESSLNPEQYLIDICHVLINQQHRTLTDIASSILHQLGECVCVHYQWSM